MGTSRGRSGGGEMGGSVPECCRGHYSPAIQLIVSSRNYVGRFCEQLILSLFYVSVFLGVVAGMSSNLFGKAHWLMEMTDSANCWGNLGGERKGFYVVYIFCVI